MFGFCSRCKEYRGEGQAWGIILRNGYPVCERCGGYIDMVE
jgi:hypothetical protein